MGTHLGELGFDHEGKQGAYKEGDGESMVEVDHL